MTTAHKVIAILLGVIAILGMVGTFFWGRASVKSVEVTTTKIERDTIIKHDTIKQSYPVEVEREVVRTEYKYLTRVERDTVLVEIPIEEREYKDEEYRAIVEGYNPRLKYIEVYPKTAYITTTETIKERKRWGFTLGAQGGYGYTPKGFQPYIGIGISFGYNF